MQRDGTFLTKQLDELESYIPRANVINEDISKADVAWHLDHTLKVINNIYDTLEASDPSLYKEDINVMRSIIFTAGIIPRGQAQSPKSVRPPEKVLTSDIQYQLGKSRKANQKYIQLPESSYFKHFGFGYLKRDKAMRFVEIHTNHHLKIIRDILNKS